MASKFDISLYGFLESYIETGSKGDLNQEHVDYLEVLSLMASMRRRYGMEKTMSFFRNAPYCISAYRVREMYYESINLFYSNEKVEKKAMRALKAEQLEKAAELVLKTAICSADMEVYGKLIKDSAIMRQLDKVDPPEIPESMYKRPIKIYSLDPKVINLAVPDRNNLAKRIDLLDVPEAEKTRLKKDARIEDIDFIDMIDEQEDKNKS